MSTKRLAAAAAVALSVGFGPAAMAEFPEDGAIRLVNPYGAGGAVDITARILSSVAGEYLNTRVDVVAMPGAGGQEAINFVKDAPADGYTLLITDYGPLITTALTEQVDYELDDWVAVVQITEVVPAFFARADGPVTSVEAWIEAAQADPGGLTIGHGRHLSVPHLPLILFEQATGTENTHIPTTGGAESLAFVLGGQTDLGAAIPSTIQGGIDTGDLVALAVASADRVASLPETPTLAELGYDVVLPAWYTVFAHKDVPAERLAILEERIVTALESESAQALGRRTGIEVRPLGMDASGEAYTRTIHSLRELLAAIGQ